MPSVLERSDATAGQTAAVANGRGPSPTAAAGEAPWHTLAAPAVLDRLGVDAETGLTEGEATARLGRFGANELVETGGRSPWRIIWEQVTATMVLILIVAAALSALLGDWKHAGAILAIVILFALLGFVQEYRAEQAMAALKRLAVPVVRVRRGGRVEELPASELVPGDVVLLEAGNLVPADGRLLEGANLRIQEAALTGESEPVEKVVEPVADRERSLGDRRNMAYMGTVVTYGRGVLAVVETGMRTELGKIATLLQGVKAEQTPLQRRLDQLGKTIGVIALVVAALIFAVGFLEGQSLEVMFLTAISVAVAAVPEGLPAVVTITLALGAQRMLKRRALLRKLPATETLGSVTTICSDKTGTLTENRMTVVALDVADRRTDLEQHVDADGHPLAEVADVHPSEALLLAGGALCNDALLQATPAGEKLVVIGDPTEGALVVAADRFGLDKAALEAALPRVAELPFDSERKRMTTVHEWPGSVAERPAGLAAVDAIDAPYVAFSKGAADGLLDRTSRIWTEQGAQPFDDGWRRRVEAAATELAAQGMRVLGVAFQPLAAIPADPAAELERDLVFVGMVGIIDPPRLEVAAAVRTCQTAGIRPVMITGDHALTALHIAKEIGIAGPGRDRVLTGPELERMSDAELGAVVEEVPVYARVSPEHKLRIVGALQRRGLVVAMTGDGVNDAPALKRADIGVAMGITGTDVSKEAADMVLRDDNFATIVAAVEEGRTIYDNLRKFVKFSIAGNIGKVMVVFFGTVLLGPLLGMPLALLPLQLLFLNLLTDGLLGLGLGVDPAERNVMRRPPTAPGAGIFAGGLARHIVQTGVVIGLVCLGVGVTAWQVGHDNWQTMLFTSLATAQMGQALAIRSSYDSLFTIGLRSNKVLLGMVALTFGLQMLAIYWGPMQGLFQTQALSALDLLICVGVGAFVFAVIEVEKWLSRRGESQPPVDRPVALVRVGEVAPRRVGTPPRGESRSPFVPGRENSFPVPGPNTRPE